MSGQWVQRRLGLRYFLGELPLFQVNFNLARLDRHFSELTDTPDESLVRWDALGPVEGVLYRSHPVGSDMPSLKRLPQAIRYVPVQYEHYYLEFAGTFDDYLGKFPQKQRYNLKRTVRKYAEFAGGLDCRQFRTRDEVAQFYSQARELSTKTYQERILGVGLPGEDAFRDDLLAKAERGEVRCFMLYHAQRPVSYLHCRSAGNVLLYDYIGYDPEYAAWSPGTVLQMCVIEMLFAEGSFRLLDFGQGAAQYKRMFSTGSQRCADIYYFRPTLRNGFYVRLHRSMDRFSSAIGRRLAAWGLKDRVKKLMRSR